MEKDLRPHVYVMTPVDDEILVRARIMFCDYENAKVLVRLIDHGDEVWRSPTALFQMDSENDDIRKHPWQAIPVTLEGIKPKNGVRFTMFFKEL